MWWSSEARRTLRVTISILFLCLDIATTESGDDLYSLLGLSRTATTQEIKQAYRKKARDTHPDKNRNVPAQQAAESFLKVVHAFEVLSDQASRDHYDRTTSRIPTNSFGAYNAEQRGRTYFQWSFQNNPIRLKDQFKVQQAQSRVLHVKSLDQLKTLMLDDSGLLERNLLLCFVTQGSVESHVDDEMVFPYPFAGMSSQGIWWEDLVQTVKVRYDDESTLTRFFDLSKDGFRNAGTPLFFFGKKAQMLTLENLSRLLTSNRREFELWVWKQMEVKLMIYNHHQYPVDVYWVQGTSAKDRGTILPGFGKLYTTMLGHEWHIRDARVDNTTDTPGRRRLSTESSLGSWKIGVKGPFISTRSDGMVEIVVEAQKCFDLSGHCTMWRNARECHRNPFYMQQYCALSCGKCIREKRFSLET